MARVGATIRRYIRQARTVERFVLLIVSGGISLVAGLWIIRLTLRWSEGWYLGVMLVLLGLGGLSYGIGSQIKFKST